MIFICDLFVRVVLVLLVSQLVSCQEVGEPCPLNNGEVGICRIYSDCPGIEELAKQSVNIPFCGFYQLTTLVVCCQNRATSPTPNDLSIGNGIAFPDDVPSKLGDSGFTTPLRKSEQKCIEYTDTVTSNVQAIPLVTNEEPININVTKCEYNSVALIVGGSPAAIGEFPFMAAIGFLSDSDTPEWKCGGTLISERWVLTAAHCTFDRTSEPEIIRLGSLQPNSRYERGRADYGVSRIITHPDYKYPLKYNDIALLATDRPVGFSKTVRPACLYAKTNVSPKVAIAAGWGQTDYWGSNSDRLLKVQLNIYDNSICAQAYQKEIATGNNQIGRGIIRSMLCAGELKGGRDTCLGDSGGPLFITENGNMCQFYIVGITSFGKLCAQENVPAIYTRVSEYVSWIENIVW